MSRRAMVRLGDVLVGELVERVDGIVEFRLLQSYLEMPDRPILGQQFEDDLLGTFKGKRNDPLPAFFSNLLPEGRLRTLLERRGGVAERDDFGLLLLLGGDLPGATVVESVDSGLGAQTELGFERDGRREDDGLRFSLAGVQLKFSVTFQNEKLSLPAEDSAGNYILKIHGAQLPGLAENEFSTMTWARAAGFDVPQCKLIETNQLDDLPLEDVEIGPNAFLIERYDRSHDARLHQEDLAQVSGLRPVHRYDHSTYEKLGRLLSVILGDEGVLEYAARLALMIASGNGDAHLKNWSLLYRDGMHAELAPLYDQVFTGAWVRTETFAGQTRKRIRRPELALKFFGVKYMNACTRALFERLDQELGLGTRGVERACDVLSTLAEVWRREESALPMAVEHKSRLRAHWESVPLLREFGPLAQ